jgi:phytoene/squalene synthetase
VINHLQDCAADFRNLNRVYIPLDTFAAARLTPDTLSLPQAPQSLLAGIRGLAGRTIELLRAAAPLSSQVEDNRLGLEIAVILRLAWTLTGKLQRRDPLSQPVHLGTSGFAGVGALGMTQGLVQRLLRIFRAAPGASEVP